LIFCKKCRQARLCACETRFNPQGNAARIWALIGHILAAAPPEASTGEGGLFPPRIIREHKGQNPSTA
jgi:hypothetical protein